MEKKELQKRASGSQTQAKNTQKRVQRSQKGAKMEPMGAKSEPKRNQRLRKGSQRVPKGNPKGAKGSQKGAKERPKWIQKSPWAPGSILGAKKVKFVDRFGVKNGSFFDQKSKKRHPKKHQKINAEKVSKNDAKRWPKWCKNGCQNHDFSFFLRRPDFSKIIVFI